MPDLTIEYYWVCSDYQRFHHVTEKGYEVDIDPDSLQYATCTCAAYKFAKKDRFGQKTCKHIAEAEKLRCTWSQQFDEGHPIDGTCPRCGKEVISVGVAV